MDEKIENAVKLIKNSYQISVLSGAGISAESGIPTFRGEDGLWKNYRAEELATPQAFSKDPELVWEWYNWRRAIISSKKPNPAHYSCAKLEKIFNSKFTLITQNVDGFHRLAGAENVLEIHGNIFEVKCLKCNIIYEERSELDNKPLCRECDGRLRPNIVWFGESLDQNILTNVYDDLATTELLLIIGTSAVVYPAASFGALAKQNGAKILEINLTSTQNSQIADVSVQGKAGEVLPLIVDSL